MSRPAYNFRIVPEIIWAIVTALVIVVGEALLAFDEGKFMADPGAWFVVLGGALARAAGGALLTALTKGAFLGPGQTPETPTSG